MTPENEKAHHQKMKEETTSQIQNLKNKVIYSRVIHATSKTTWLDYYIVGTNRYTKQRELLRVTYGIALLLGEKLDKKHQGIKVSGYNFSKSFEPIYNLFTFVFRNPDWQKDYRVEAI